jgi:hypothetical protein
MKSLLAAALVVGLAGMTSSALAQGRPPHGVEWAHPGVNMAPATPGVTQARGQVSVAPPAALGFSIVVTKPDGAHPLGDGPAVVVIQNKP